MDKQLLSAELLLYYPDGEKIMVHWSHRYLSRLYKQGFRWCTTCNFLVKTTEKLCRKCRNAMRTKIRNKRGYIFNHSVSKDAPMMIDKNRGVVI